MSFISCMILIFLAIDYANATTYYVSNKGNDQSNGLDPNHAWLTVEKIRLSFAQFQPGDSILFERGSTFNGSLTILKSGLPHSELYIGAYGVGEKPIISGALEIKKWKSYRENIWVAECSSCTNELANLFIGKKLQLPGRFPNTGYRSITCNGDCRSSFSDNDLIVENGKWNNAEVIIKSSRWTIDNLAISSIENKTFRLSAPTSYVLENGFGYFIQKHLSTLDKNGEWFYDKNNKKIFLYADSKLKLSQNLIEVSFNNTGLEMTELHDVIVENIAFAYHHNLGIQIKGGKNIRINACYIAFSGVNGVEATSCTNLKIENTIISDSNNNGVEWTNTSGLFINNSIYRTGIHPGLGKSGDGAYIALRISSNKSEIEKTLFQYNNIDSTGYIGIDFRAGNTEIKNNIISNFCMIKDDGAGIYTWENTLGNNNIEKNIITNGIGTDEGTNSNQLFASGVYIDDRSSDIMITDNTITDCAMTGIFIHNSKKILIYGNTLIGNGNSIDNKVRSQLLIKLDAKSSAENEKGLALSVNNNKFVATSESVPCIYLIAKEKLDLKDLGKFDKNYFGSFSKNEIVARIYGLQEYCESLELLSLKEWQSTSHQDVTSTIQIFQNSPTETTKNIITNGDFKLGIKGWYHWPEEALMKLITNSPPYKTSLKINLQKEPEAMIYYSGLSLDAQKNYRLSFSAKAPVSCKVEFVPLMAESPWNALGNYTCFSIDTIEHTFIYHFKPLRNSENARINFKSNDDFLISNVKLHVVQNWTTGKSFQHIYNATNKSKSVKIPSGFFLLEGTSIPTPINLPPYSSLILIKKNTNKSD